MACSLNGIPLGIQYVWQACTLYVVCMVGIQFVRQACRLNGGYLACMVGTVSSLNGMSYVWKACTM